MGSEQYSLCNRFLADAALREANPTDSACAEATLMMLLGSTTPGSMVPPSPMTACSYWPTKWLLLTLC